MQTGGFTVVQDAVAPSAPFSPQPTRNGIMAVVIGLVLGLGLAFLLDHLDKRVKDLKSLEQYTSAPVLATIPPAGGRWRRRGGRKESSAVGFASDPWMLESFRALRSSLEYLDIDNGAKGSKNKKILITSGLPGEGKTVTAINLSLSLALAGNRVVLMDCDLRQPSVGRYLGLTKEAGLSTVLTDKTTLRDALQLVDIVPYLPPAIREKAVTGEGLPGGGNLRCLTSGPIPPNPAEILSSKRLEAVLQQVAEDCDFLVIDTPPVLTVADAQILSPKVDGVLIEARMHWATQEELEESSEQLRRSGGRILGVVACGVKAKALPYRAQTYYRYGQS
jgi:tyrosine-protein kinase